MRELTEKQGKVLTWIKGYLREHDTRQPAQNSPTGSG